MKLKREGTNAWFHGEERKQHLRQWTLLAFDFLALPSSFLRKIVLRPGLRPSERGDRLHLPKTQLAGAVEPFPARILRGILRRSPEYKGLPIPNPNPDVWLLPPWFVFEYLAWCHEFKDGEGQKSTAISE
jgi:hypothetical protein